MLSSAYHRGMTMMTAHHGRAIGRPDGLVVAACLFHGFSDPSRLTIIRHLALGEHKVRELTDHVGLAQSTVSRHLACLLDCGLVQVRPLGRSSMYSLAHPEVTMRLLNSAEELLEATGEAVALCPTFGPASLHGAGEQE